MLWTASVGLSDSSRTIAASKNVFRLEPWNRFDAMPLYQSHVRENFQQPRKSCISSWSLVPSGAACGKRFTCPATQRASAARPSRSGLKKVQQGEKSPIRRWAFARILGGILAARDPRSVSSTFRHIFSGRWSDKGKGPAERRWVVFNLEFCEELLSLFFNFLFFLSFFLIDSKRSRSIHLFLPLPLLLPHFYSHVLDVDQGRPRPLELTIH